MAEYIKREDIGLTDFEIILCRGDYKEALKMLLDKIENLPAADVQPVVLCCDCKHKGWVQEPEHGKSVDYCRLIERCVDKQFFCAAGERKTNCGADMR